MDFSAAQKRVIDNAVDNILVSAAAGSGKTTVLVERIINRIKTGELTIDDILVVTFTNDAAVHMQKKIEDALRKEYDSSEGDPGKREYFSRQIDKLSNAYIQTFDSFCQRVVTEKGYVLADKDRVCFEPGFAILDEGELKLLRSRAAALAVEKAYLKDIEAGRTGDKSDFILLTERSGDGRSDFTLTNDLVASYDKLRCLADYRTKIMKACEEYEDRDINGRLYPILGAVITRFKDCADRFDDLRDIIGTDKGTYLVKKTGRKEDEIVALSRSILDNMREVIYRADKLYAEGAAAGDILNALTSVDLSELVGNNLSKTLPEAAPFSAVCKAYDASGFKTRKGTFDLSDGYNEVFRTLLKTPLDKITKMAEENVKVVRAYTDLLLDMDDIYSELKYSVRGMDFADLEYAAFDIFSDSEASGYYRSKFSEIYVDEYQDNTDLQDEIIRKISRSGKNVFRVGDVKQSIYRFRNSDPSIFTGMLSDMEEDPGCGTPLYLNENYRSRKEILNFINFIFLQLMDKEVSGIDYPKQMLHFPESKVCDFDPYYIPDVLVVDEDYLSFDAEEGSDEEEGSGSEGEDDASGQEAEKATADDELTDPSGKDVISLKNGIEYLIRDYIAKDPVNHKLSDICVLTETRSMANAVTEHLNDYGIDAAGINITMIFTDNDIHRLASLIIVLGNSLRDEYMLGVLLAPFEFTNFTLDEIAHINAYLQSRGSDLKINLIDRIRIYRETADEDSEGELYLRVEHFLDTFDDLRSFAMTSSIASTAEEVFKKTHIKATIEDNYGNTAKINLFKNWLTSNFKRYGTDISGISSELEQMKIKFSDGTSVETRDSEPDKVTVMNVHKSKGLEYKYVILVVKPRRRQSDSSISGICFDDKDGWYSDWYDEDELCRKTSFEMRIKNEDITVEDNSELMRLLYVALTRAQDKLSIVMTADSKGGKSNNMYKTAAENAALMAAPEVKRRETVLRAKTGGIFYFLLLALMRSPYWNNAVAERFGEAGLVCEDPDCITDRDTFGELLDDHDPVCVRVPSEADLYDLRPVEEYPDDELFGEEDPENIPDMDLYGGDDEDGADEDPELPDRIAEYRYQSETEIPFKVSVTSASTGKFTSTTHVDMNIRSRSEYGGGNKMLSSAAKGTILHVLMRAAQPDEILSDYETAVDKLINEGFFNGADSATVRKTCLEMKQGVVDFYNSDIGRRLDIADRNSAAKYEYPLVFSIYTDPGDPDSGSVLVQGIADLVFEEDDGFVILDYKTDSLPDMDDEEREDEARARHSVQISSYAAAFAKSGKKIKEKWVYLVRYSQFVRI